MGISIKLNMFFRNYTQLVECDTSLIAGMAAVTVTTNRLRCSSHAQQFPHVLILLVDKNGIVRGNVCEDFDSFHYITITLSHTTAAVPPSTLMAVPVI